MYSDGDIRKLMEASLQLHSRRGLRATTYSTLFGLLAVTGLRIGECLALDHQDVDLVDGMDLLQQGVDRSVIALWLGHESIETTEVYLHASMEMKEKALAKATSSKTRNGRYRPDDRLLAFLKSL